MATWDASLPKPLFDGYALAPADPVLRSDMEFGAARSRRRTFARDDKISVQWLFTDAQMATFRTWFDDSSQAAGGSAWFSIALAIGATGIDTVEAKFAGMWQSSLQPGMFWRVTAQLQVR